MGYRYGVERFEKCFCVCFLLNTFEDSQAFHPSPTSKKPKLHPRVLSYTGVNMIPNQYLCDSELCTLQRQSPYTYVVCIWVIP